MKRTRILCCIIVLVSLQSLSFFTMPALANGEGPESIKPNGLGVADSYLGAELSKLLFHASEEEKATIWEHLDEQEKYSVIEYNTVVHVAFEIVDVVSTASQMSVLASGCDVRGLKEKGYNSFGNVLWEYYSKVEWCFNGSSVTSKFATRTGQAGPFPSLWEYVGDAVPPVEGGGVGQSYYRIWCNGYFKLAVAGYPIQTAYPWIDITVRGTGTASATSGQ